MSKRPKPNPTHTPGWAKGMQKLGPGIYATPDGKMHISESEICEYFGVPRTRENVRIIEETAVQAIREQLGFTGPVETVGDEPAS